MNIILWGDNRYDEKSHFPCLPLMKISAYYKMRGDSVRLYDKDVTDCDILYKSKTFSFTNDLDFIPPDGKVVQGGSGYAIALDGDNREVYDKSLDVLLSDDIECLYPDYKLYPGLVHEAYGFLTRGCPRACSFCVVSKKEGRASRKVADLTDIWRGQKKIKLMDANILACGEREGLLKQLIKSGSSIDYTQGLDVRLMNDDMAKLICRTKTEMIHFAFDGMKDEAYTIKGLEIFKKYFDKGAGVCRVYILVNYDTTREEDVYRVKKVTELGYQPYIMIYRRGTHDAFLTHLRTWCNSTMYYFSCDFSEWTPYKNGKSCYDLYGDISKIKAS